MSFANPNQTNLPDFIVFCQAQGITTEILATDSPYYAWAFNYAVNVTICVPQMPAILYVLAVYNLGMQKLIETAQDTSPSTFFADNRKSFGLLSFALPIANSGDQGTNESGVVPEWLKEATLSTLDLLKTPWGRAYLEYAQEWGPTVVGIS